MALKEKIKEIVQPKKQRRLVAPRNVKRFKAEGWKEIDKENELTLMEK